MCVAVSAGLLFRNEQASSSARTINVILLEGRMPVKSHIRALHVLLSLSIAHCSNCSSVISAVGGVE